MANFHDATIIISLRRAFSHHERSLSHNRRKRRERKAVEQAMEIPTQKSTIERGTSRRQGAKPRRRKGSRSRSSSTRSSAATRSPAAMANRKSLRLPPGAGSARRRRRRRRPRRQTLQTRCTRPPPMMMRWQTRCTKSLSTRHLSPRRLPQRGWLVHKPGQRRRRRLWQRSRSQRYKRPSVTL